MWKLSDTQWLNPLAISHVMDYPTEERIMVYLMAGTNTDSGDYATYYKQERQILLAFLSQHSLHHPPYIVRDDSDEPPF